MVGRSCEKEINRSQINQGSRYMENGDGFRSMEMNRSRERSISKEKRRPWEKSRSRERSRARKCNIFCDWDR